MLPPDEPVASADGTGLKETRLELTSEASPPDATSDVCPDGVEEGALHVPADRLRATRDWLPLADADGFFASFTAGGPEASALFCYTTGMASEADASDEASGACIFSCATGLRLGFPAEASAPFATLFLPATAPGRAVERVEVYAVVPREVLRRTAMPAEMSFGVTTRRGAGFACASFATFSSSLPPSGCSCEGDLPSAIERSATHSEKEDSPLPTGTSLPARGATTGLTFSPTTSAHCQFLRPGAGA